MAVNEQIVTGRKFRKLIDEANKIWQRISFWTKSSDVEFEDGKNAETKLGAINGITSDLSCEESTIAASAAALNQVNRSLGGCILQQKGNDFYIVGADSVPKKLGSGGMLTYKKVSFSNVVSTTSAYSHDINIDADKDCFIFSAVCYINDLNKHLYCLSYYNSNDKTIKNITSNLGGFTIISETKIRFYVGTHCATGTGLVAIMENE